jgi:hypothetical protein
MFIFLPYYVLFISYVAIKIPSAGIFCASQKCFMVNLTRSTEDGWYQFPADVRRDLCFE